MYCERHVTGLVTRWDRLDTSNLRICLYQSMKHIVSRLTYVLADPTPLFQRCLPQISMTLGTWICATHHGMATPQSGTYRVQISPDARREIINSGISSCREVQSPTKIHSVVKWPVLTKSLHTHRTIINSHDTSLATIMWMYHPSCGSSEPTIGALPMIIDNRQGPSWKVDVRLAPKSGLFPSPRFWDRRKERGDVLHRLPMSITLVDASTLLAAIVLHLPVVWT
ncbi:hypothetical protein IAQ61_002192, partial [Plenodomus lingam]|uniref:uncharacterized protein n=1 Tax=Leptosphaeria maculans TaxID=5022 RepID=UPI00332C204F